MQNAATLLGEDFSFADLADASARGGLIGAILGGGVGALSRGPRDVVGPGANTDAVPEEPPRDGDSAAPGADTSMDTVLDDDVDQGFDQTQDEDVDLEADLDVDPDAPPPARPAQPPVTAPNAAPDIAAALDPQPTLEQGLERVDQGLGAVQEQATQARQATNTPEAVNAAGVSDEVRVALRQQTARQAGQTVPAAPTAGLVQPQTAQVTPPSTAVGISEAQVAPAPVSAPDDSAFAPRGEPAQLPAAPAPDDSVFRVDQATGRRVVPAQDRLSQRRRGMVTTQRQGAELAQELAGVSREEARRQQSAELNRESRGEQRDAREEAAQRVLQGFAPTQNEFETYQGGSNEALPITQARLEAMLEAAERAGIEIPKAARNTPPSVTALIKARQMRDQLAKQKRKPAAKVMAKFVEEQGIAGTGSEAAQEVRDTARVENNMAGTGGNDGAPVGSVRGQKVSEMATENTPESLVEEADELTSARERDRRQVERRLRERREEGKFEADGAPTAVVYRDEDTDDKTVGAAGFKRVVKQITSAPTVERRAARRMLPKPATKPARPEGARKAIEAAKAVAAKRAERQASRQTTEAARQELVQEQVETAAREADLEILPISSAVNDGMVAPELGPFQEVRASNGESAIAIATTDLASVLERVPLTQSPYSGTPVGLRRMVRDRISELAGNVPVHVVSDADMARLVQTTRAAGFYSPSDNYIAVAESAVGQSDWFTHVMLHEGAHAAFENALRADPSARQDLRRIMDAVRAAQAPGALSRPTYSYGFTNESEFIAEALSNPRFQDMLRVTPVPSPLAARLGMQAGRANVWQAMVTLVRKLFSIPRGGYSGLEAVLRVAQRLDNQATSAPSVLQAEPNTLPISMDAMSDGLRQHTRAGRKSIGSWLRTTGIKLVTTDKLRQDALGIDEAFGSAVNDWVSRLQSMTDATATEARVGLQLAEELMTFARQSKEMAQAVSRYVDTVLEATTLQVGLVNGENVGDSEMRAANPHLFTRSDKKGARHPIDGAQARAHLRRLQGQFDALPKDLRNYHDKTQKFFTEKQNRITANAINAILDTLPADRLTAEQREGIVKRTMRGKLVDEDRALIANEVVFQGLQNAKQLRMVKGTYVPLMRNGDWIVRTREKVGDLMGGAIVEKNGRTFVEFKAAPGQDEKASDADARRQAERWLGATNLAVNGRIFRQRYLRSTGEAISPADAVGQDVDFAYRVPVQLRGFYAFDSETEAERFIAENRDKLDFRDAGGTDRVPLPRAEFSGTEELSFNQLGSLIASIDRLDRSDAEKGELRLSVQQAAARMTPGTRVKHRALPRTNAYGASKDLAHNMAVYSESTAAYIARQERLPAVREAQARARAELKRTDELSGRRSAIFEELSSRMDGAVGYEKQSQVLNDIMTVSSLNYLASPAYSIVNATQVGMVTYPYLAGRHGGVRSAAALRNAYNAIGAARAAGLGAANTLAAARQFSRVALSVQTPLEMVLGNVRRAEDGADLVKMLDHLMDRGLLARDAGFDVRQSFAEARGTWGRSLAKVDRIARQLPLAVEAINRSVTGIAAYRLARGQGRAHDDAVAYAFDAVMNTQGDYSAFNSPKLFNSGVGRLLLQFKKYPLLYTQLIVGMAKKAFGGATGEEKKIALRQLSYIAGVQIAVAGAFSLPGLELIKVPMMLAAALGLNDGWEELERDLREVAEESLGAKPAELLTKGALSRMIGVDLSTRLSAADLWTFGEPRGESRADIQAYLFGSFAGAPANMLVEMWAGAAKAGDGDWAGAMAGFVPLKIVRDTAKAVGDDELNPAERIVQSSGLTPASRAERSEETGNRIRDQRRQREEYRRLRDGYLEAGSATERARMRREIEAYNRTVGFRQRIYTSTLDRIRREGAN